MAGLETKFLPPGDMPDFHRPFWEGLRQHRLLVQQCAEGHLRFIPTEMCDRCASRSWTWEAMSGRGEIYSFTIVHRGPTPAYQGDAPYAIVHVTLAEGPRMIGNLVGCDPGDIRIGMPVEIAFYEASAEWTLYRFVPASD